MGGNHNINVVGNPKPEPKPIKEKTVESVLTQKPAPNYYVGDWIDEKCPICGAQLLGNQNGDKWCSYIKCSHDGKTPPFIENKNPNTIIFDSYEAEKNDINLANPKINFEVEDTIQKYNNNDIPDYTQSLKDLMRQQHKNTANIKFED